MSKLQKIIPLILLIFMLLIPVKSEAFPTFDEMKSQADSWLSKGQSGSKVKEDDMLLNRMTFGYRKIV